MSEVHIHFFSTSKDFGFFKLGYASWLFYSSSEKSPLLSKSSLALSLERGRELNKNTGLPCESVACGCSGGQLPVSEVAVPHALSNVDHNACCLS